MLFPPHHGETQCCILKRYMLRYLENEDYLYLSSIGDLCYAGFRSSEKQVNVADRTNP